MDGITEKSTVTGEVLGGDAGAYNTFDRPDAVKPAALGGMEVKGGGVKAVLPASSVAAIRIVRE